MHLFKIASFVYSGPYNNFESFLVAFATNTVNIKIKAGYDPLKQEAVK